jgi:CcmD family protein
MRVDKRTTGFVRRVLAGMLLMVALAAPTAIAQQPAQPTPPSTPDGFVPVDTLPPASEQLPAAPLVIVAYAVAWLAVFGYLWSIWQRLNRVERELLEANRRVAANGRR